jgi:glutamate/aspartate transport system substrate-binding protein
MRLRLPAAIAFLVIALSACERQAADNPNAAPDTLKKIRDAKAITIGYRESSVPFSYYDNRKQVIGYSFDLAMKVVQEVRHELGTPDIEIRLQPVSPEDRMELVRSGAVDLECGTTGNTLARQQLVGYSNSIFIVRMQILTRKDYGIHDFPDLAGKRVVTTAGTTNVDRIHRMNAEKGMGMKVTLAKDHRDAFIELETGRVEAFLMDDALLWGERARAVRWGDWVVTGTPQVREAYGCIMRKGDARFKQVVDRALAKAMAPEAFEPLYRKWFQSPIPPKGQTLDFPLSEEMKELIRQPNDKAFE